MSSDSGEAETTYTVFAGERLLCSGDLRSMLSRTKQALDREPHSSVLIFDDRSGRQIEFDFRGTIEEVLEREAPEKPRPGPGRPKLGVVSREISLLPRHWSWLEEQPQGASAALRRLVDEARKRDPGKEQARLARDAAGRIMWSIAGDLPNFEEASRALYAQDQGRFDELIAAWPKDIRTHLSRLVRESIRAGHAATGS
jgi:hypothetical protein